MDLTQDVVRELLHYNPETGEFTWKHRPRHYCQSDKSHKWWNSRFAGKPAGTTVANPLGYSHQRINIFARPRDYHRVAWLWMTGEWPDGHIDHINRDATDNRWCNLRLIAGREENARNASRRKDNRSGISGVCWRKDMGKWQAYGNHNKKRYHLGFFDEIDEAAMEVLEFRADHGFSRDHGLELAHYHMN